MNKVDVLPRKRTGRFNWTLRTKFYLAAIALIVVIAILSIAVWLDSGEQALQRAQVDLDEAIETSSAEIGGETTRLATLGTWLAAQESLVGFVENNNGPALGRFLEPLIQPNFLETIAVAHPDGQVLVQVNPVEGANIGANVLSLPGAHEALDGASSIHIREVPGIGVQQYSVLPVYDTSQKSPVGILVMIFTLDVNSVRRFSHDGSRDVAITLGDHVVVSTLTDKQGKPWMNEKWTGNLDAKDTVSASRFVNLQTGTGDYVFRFTPLPGPPSNATPSFGVGVSVDAIRTAQLTDFRLFGSGFLAVCLAIVTLFTFFDRSLVNSTRQLLAFASRIGAGDLEHPFVLTRTDEAELGNAFDRMRLNLNSSFQTLQLEKQRSQALFQSMGVPAVITDSNQIILGANRAAEGLFRQNLSGLLNHRLYDLFVMDGALEHGTSPAWRTGSDGFRDQPLLMRARYPLHDRPQIFVDIITSRIEIDHEQPTYIHLMQDATQQERYSAAKDGFLLNIAHELRTPLASLRASIDLLLEDYGTMSRADLGAMLRTLQKSSVKFQALTESLIEIENIQAGRFRVRPTPTQLDDIIEDAISQIAPLLESRGQDLELRLVRPESISVIADRRRIMQVLVNLLTNASKYSPETSTIVLSTCRDMGYVYVGVTDFGPGIPPEDQTNLFQRFYRTKQVENEGVGIGLGLALAKEIVEAHGGNIRLASDAGRGTTFWFSLREQEA